MKHVLTGLFLLLLTTACSEEGQQTITPVPFNQVTLTDGFWKERMQTEINVTVPFSVEQSAPAVERFRRCAAFLAGDSTALPETHRFISSDLYKVMEGVAYSLMIRPDKELEEFMDEVTDLIAASQKRTDIYIFRIFVVIPIPERWERNPIRGLFIAMSFIMWGICTKQR